jgi:hypothetical protein
MANHIICWMCGTMMKVLELKIDLILSNNKHVLKKSKRNKFKYTIFS